MFSRRMKRALAGACALASVAAFGLAGAHPAFADHGHGGGGTSGGPGPGAGGGHNDHADHDKAEHGVANPGGGHDPVDVDPAPHH